MRADPRASTVRHIGGVAATVLAEIYGTPLLVLEGESLDAACATFAHARDTFGFEISYAAKALLFVALARRIARAGFGIDVCSLGELLTVERAKVAPASITLHGCGKTDDELRAATQGRLGRIVVDGMEEIARFAALAREAKPGDVAEVIVRVNTGLEAHTHAYVRTGGEDSKFGIALDQLDAAIAAIAREPALRLRGVHSHIGSQILDGEAFVANVPLALEAYAHARASEPRANTLILGGGFGVEPHPDAAPFDLAATLAAIAGAVRKCAGGLRLPLPQIGLEPGRALVAAAGTSLYRVVAIKTNGASRFAIVDGSLADNPRPALYGAYHDPTLASRSSTAPLVPIAVCGRSCESDRLVDADLPADLGAGDLLALGTTGAYTYSMASNYNRFARPAIVLAQAGDHRLVVRREPLEDLVRNDVDEA